MTPAYQHNDAPCTREHFYAIACDPRRSVVVEACAGAGKTWMLVSRILRALLAGSAPHEILAITFTKKAAGEMRERLLQWLEEFARPRPADPARGRDAETPAQWQQRLHDELIARGIEPQHASAQRERLQNLYQSLLAHGRPVQIRTFHSWFAALLRTAPLAVLHELGLPSAYELLEDDEDAVAELWRPFLRQVAADAGLRDDYADLVRALGRHNAHKALGAALARRVEFQLADQAGHVHGAVPPFDAWYPRMAGVDEPIDWLLGREAGRTLLLEAADALLPLARTYAQKGVELKEALHAADWDGVAAALLTKGKPRVFAKDKTPAIVRAAQDEVQAVCAALEQHQAWAHHQRMARLTRQLIASFAQLKRERGWVDMSDVERAALKLLGDHVLSAWVQERLDARVRHLLIDEFQDTNPLQWLALKAWLSGYGGAGGGQDAPSVFIVGDPKQSIYRFRRAEPKVFLDAQRFVVQALGGERLATDHTHRNAPTVLQAVNAVMQQAQETGQFDGFRAHSTESEAAGQVQALPRIQRPEKAGTSGAEPVWRDSLTTPRTEPEETLRTLECRQAACWIATRIAAGVPPQKIMVLARKREPLGLLRTELRTLGIACEQPEKQVLGRQPAVQDVLALVDALVSPGHDLALARALKSPLFGLHDDDLARLALAVRAAGAARPAWLDVLPIAELAGHDGQGLHADLMVYRQWLHNLPPHDALQAIYHHRDVLARYAGAAPEPERAQVLAQLRALLGTSLDVHGGRFVTAYQWLRALRREQRPLPRHAAPEAVQLLTVHGAKGLEADEVLLLDSASAAVARGEPTVLLDWPGDERAPCRLVFLARSSAPPPSAQDLDASERAAQEREELNALYVAMTRARQRLVLSAFVPYQQPPSSWWQRLQPQAQDVAVPAVTALAEAGRARPWVLMELPKAPIVPASEAIQSEAIPIDGISEPPDEAARIGEAMHWLLEHAGDTPGGWSARRLAQVRRRFELNAEQAARAAALAQRIRGGEAAWAWSAHEVLEAFNEIEVIHQGQRLRIDRLVRRCAGAHGPETWWVLDYKSAARPEQNAALIDQLARYRAAIERLHPGQAVRVAFLSGEGRVVDV